MARTTGAIVALARIFSICVGVRLFTIYMSWLVLSNSLLSFKRLREYSTGSLDAFVDATGYHRRYGMWLLNHAEEVHTRPRSQRAPR